MKRLILLLLLCPFILFAQDPKLPKSEWTVYSSTLTYDKEAFGDKGFNAQGITDIIFTPSGEMIIAAPETPITFYKDGKEYGTERIVFAKEGAKLQLVKGGETQSAQTLALDKGGNLWFGSSKGLHKLDAIHFQDLEKMKSSTMIEGVRFSAETPGMPFNDVKIIRMDNAGNLWVAGAKTSGIVKVEHKGLSKYENGAWTNFLVSGAEDKEVKLIEFDNQNNPIVASQTGLLSTSISWYKDGAWKSLGTPAGKNDATVALAFVNDTPYAATVTAIYQWKNEKWEKLPVKTSMMINDMKVDKNKNLWVASSYGAVCLNSGGGEYTITSSNSPLPSNSVKKVIIDNNNKKWFLADLGIVGFKEPADLSNENMTVYTKFNSSFADGRIESIVPYKNGLLLSNNDRGLVSFDGKTFTILTTETETYYTNIAQDKNGMVYLGTFRYLHKYDGNNYSKWVWKDDTGRQINSVLVDNQNTLWIASDGISKFDGTVWQNFNKKNAGLSSNSALKLFQDSKNNIWASLYDGVAKYDGAAWTVFTKKTAGVALGNMTGIAETKDGKVLFSNGYKLIEYDGTAMKEVAGFKEAGTLRNMIIDTDGTLLVATEENGIVKFKDGVQSFCNQFNCGLPTNAISQIYRDSNGKLWVGFGLPPAVERPTIGAMGQPGQAPAAAPESPRDVFMKRLKAFDSVYGFMELKKL
ncbi:MAG TPA: two-component regulator propeller domain-containing protein [Chryseosolibacter sp.]